MARKLTATKVNSKLETLEARLQAIAKKTAQFGPGLEWEDLYQHMLKALLERNLADPTFFEQTDAYICKYAEFMAKHACKKAQIYLRYVDVEGFEIDPEESEEGDTSSLDLAVTREKLQANIAAVETEVMLEELSEVFIEGCDSLTSDNLKVVYLLYQGYKQVEIAEIMGISKPAVHQRIKTIANQLQGFVAGY